MASNEYDEWVAETRLLPDKKELQKYMEGRETSVADLCDLLHIDEDSAIMLVWTTEVHGAEMLLSTFRKMRDWVHTHILLQIDEISPALTRRLHNTVYTEIYGEYDDSDIYGMASDGEFKAFANMCRHGINGENEADLIDAYRSFIIQQMGAQHIPDDLWQDVVLYDDDGGDISIRSAVNAQTASGDPIIIFPYNETVDSLEFRDIFAECIQRVGTNHGVVVAFRFTKRVYKYVASLKEKKGVDIELLTVRELIDSNQVVDDEPRC